MVCGKVAILNLWEKSGLIYLTFLSNLETPQTENAGCRMNMTISSGGIKLVSLESGRILANHEMHGISFASGGEKVQL